MNDNKNFVVVGGSSGIGLELVKRLSERGDHVVAVSRSGKRHDSNPLVDHLALDITEDDVQPHQLPAEIHGLAYCVGSINLGPVSRLRPETLMDDFRLNVVGLIKALQFSLPGMKAAGSSSMIVFSTVAVSQGMAMHSSVAAAKGGVEALTRSLAAELAPKIRVNCIAPSLTATPLSERLISTEKQRETMAQKHPLKRFGQPQDAASLADFLLSDQAGWITGQVIGVDGGLATIRS